jgi:hypothetical protein
VIGKEFIDNGDSFNNPFIFHFLFCLVVSHPLFQLLRICQKVSNPVPNRVVDRLKSELRHAAFQIGFCPIVGSTPVIEIVATCVLGSPKTGVSIHSRSTKPAPNMTRHQVLMLAVCTTQCFVPFPYLSGLKP